MDGLSVAIAEHSTKKVIRAAARGLSHERLRLRNPRPSHDRLAATYSMGYVMSEFHREDRYIVIKHTDMEKLPHEVRRNFSGRCRNFYEQMLIAGAPARRFLVVESDWPEYEPAWQMIERRVTGNDIPVAETMGYSVTGNRYMIALTKQEILNHSPSYAGCMFELVARSALDAQRLRADTAEAGSVRKDGVIEDLMQSNSDMTTCLAAAEQRIADQLKLIAGLVEYADNLLSDVNSAWQYAGSTGNPETHRDTDYVAAVAMLAALNLKPEEGSHEL